MYRQEYSNEYKSKKNREYYEIGKKFLSDYPELRRGNSSPRVSVHWPKPDGLCGTHFDPHPIPIIEIGLFDFMHNIMEMKAGVPVAWHEMLDKYGNAS